MKLRRKNNNKKIHSFIIAICCLSFVSKAQFTDTITDVYQDLELISWTEKFILKEGYVKKTIKGYQLPTFSTYNKDLNGLYSIHIIEKQDFDTACIVLYRLHIGSDHTHPTIMVRTKKLNKPSEFKVYGRSANLESVYKMYLFFDRYTRFSIPTKEYCYHMLLQNYNDFINPHY
jgi:hypothetical protein